MKNLVSIIVPIYKVEDYLKKCVDSLINQTYKDIEIILVDDGSPDNCPKLCDEFALRDSRVKVIHKINGGLSSARNAGLDVCNGDFVMFIDSDDFVSENMVETLLNNYEKTKADIIVCDYYLVYGDNLKIQKHYKKNKIVSGIDKYKMLYKSRYAIPSLVAWNKLYKIHIFDKIRYDNGKLHEDEFIICKLLNSANQVSYITDKLYFYVQRNGSIMSKFNTKSFDKIEAFDLRINFFANNGLNELIDEAKYQKLLACKYCLNGYINSDLEKDDSLIEKLKNDIFMLLKDLMFSKKLKFVRKVKVILYAVLFNIYKK